MAASQAGNPFYNAAPTLTNTYTISQNDQIISDFLPADGTLFQVTEVTNLSATATSDLEVSFAVISGPAIITDGDRLSFSATGTVQIEASQGGNDDWNAAPPVTHTYTVNKADQFISNFTPTNGTEFLVTDTETMEADASSGLTVGFNIISGPAFIVGRNDLHFNGPGTVLVETFQLGNDDWSAAIPLTNTYTVIKAEQSISGFTPADGSAFPVGTVTNLFATATSGLPVDFKVISGPAVLIGENLLVFDGVGTVLVEASQLGDADWNAAVSVCSEKSGEDPAVGGRHRGLGHTRQTTNQSVIAFLNEDHGRSPHGQHTQQHIGSADEFFASILCPGMGNGNTEDEIQDGPGHKRPDVHASCGAA